jgi:hypothetical protein
MKETSVFLVKMKEKIKQGDYNDFLTIPFLSQELLYHTIKTKFNKKVDSGGTPILTDVDIKECINEAKETAIHTLKIFLETELVVITPEGLRVSEKGKAALQHASKISK